MKVAWFSTRLWSPLSIYSILGFLTKDNWYVLWFILVFTTFGDILDKMYRWQITTVFLFSFSMKQTEKFHCPYCQPIVKEFSTKNGMFVHVKTFHPERYEEVRELFGERPEIRYPCSFCAKMLHGNARRHERNCGKNPNRAQTPTYTQLLEDFLEKVGRWAVTIGWESKTINVSTWKAYKLSLIHIWRCRRRG